MASSAKSNTSELSFLSGGGEMGSLMRSYDWKSHPLGDPVNWPPSLKNTIRIILSSSFPMVIWWSKDLYMFHNDPYLPALGEKHPQALGASARVMWSEIWEQLGGVIEGVVNEGKQWYAEDMLVPLNRKGFLEDTYWTFSYSPLYDDTGSINGLFCACTEGTNKVLGQRRLKVIKDIAEVSALSRSMAHLGESISNVLNENTSDLPFSLFYQMVDEGKKAYLLVKSGNVPSEAAPEIINFTLPEKEKVWDLITLKDTKQTKVINNFSQVYLQNHSAEWPEMIKTAVVIPIFKSGQDRLNGFFIAGVNPNLEYNEDYENYFHLLIGQVNLGISNLQFLEKEKNLLNKTEEERKKLYKIFMQAPALVCIFKGPDHVYELVNPLYQSLFDNRELIGKPVREALPELEGQGIFELLDQVYSTGKSFIGEEVKALISKTEGAPLEEAYFTVIYEAIRDENNQITGIYQFSYEVTAQVLAKQNLSRYNAELAAKNEELVKVNSDLDNFIYAASHDLKAPVSNLEGLFNTLFNDIDVNEDVLVLKEMISKSFDRFKNTIKDLTEISKVQKGDAQETEMINLKDLFEDVKSGIKDQIESKNAEVHASFAVDEIKFSKKNLRSILYNFISNGIKYSDPRRKPEVKVSAEKDNGFVVLTISDNGLGIAEESRNKIFQMFKRLHDHVEGSGIGLYIAKRIIDNVGGRVELESEVGKGSTFRIYLPEIDCAYLN